MAKKKFDTAAAYAAMGGSSPMGAAAPAQTTGEPDADDTTTGPPDGDADNQGLMLTADQVSQMQHLKQSGDMASLGQFVAQLLPQ